MLFLGIDGGTSGCRAVVIDEAKRRVASAQQDLSLTDSQLDPQLWKQALEACLEKLFQQCAADQIVGISADGTSGSVFLSDALGQPISPALLYHDTRAREFVDQIQRIAPHDSPAQGSGSALARLVYLSRNYASIHGVKIISHCDYLLQQFGATIGVSDWNNCLKLGFDPVQLSWPEWIKQFALPQSVFPSVIPPGEKISCVSRHCHQYWGLPKDCSIYAGTTDSIAAFIATGAGNRDAVTSLGTTLAIKLISQRPIFNQHYGIYSHRLNNHWLVGGASNTGGGVLRNYFDDQQLQQLSRQINLSKTSDLNYYPLSRPGERFPTSDPNLPPQISPRPDDDVLFLQGLFEGIARIESKAYERLMELGAQRPERILTVGGGAKNATWQEIRQQIIGIPIEKAPQHDAAYGAALLAWAGVHHRGVFQ